MQVKFLNQKLIFREGKTLTVFPSFSFVLRASTEDGPPPRDRSLYVSGPLLSHQARWLDTPVGNIPSTGISVLRNTPATRS
jgi:hypothetical protein